MSFDTDEGYREPIATLNLKGNFKRFITIIYVAFFLLFLYFLAFFELKRIALPGNEVILKIYIIYCISSFLLFSFVLFRVVNIKSIKLYEDKIVQKIYVGWLPPFNQTIRYMPGQIKLCISTGENGLSICILPSDDPLHIGCKGTYFRLNSIRLFLPKFPSDEGKQDILNFLNFLIKNASDLKNKEKLQEFKEKYYKDKDTTKRELSSTETEDSNIDFDAFKELKMSFDTDEGYREPVATVSLRFTFKLLIVSIGQFFLTIWGIDYTYKAYTDPSYFLNNKYFYAARYYWPFFLIMGIPGSILLAFLSMYFINFKRIEVYKDRVVQRARIKWLPPFNKSFEYKPEQIKVYYDSMVYHIVFSKSKNICNSFIFQLLHFSIACKGIIRFFTNKSQKYSFYRKDEVLALINFLLEKIEDKENIKKLEKFKGEVLKWK